MGSCSSRCAARARVELRAAHRAPNRLIGIRGGRLLIVLCAAAAGTLLLISATPAGAGRVFFFSCVRLVLLDYFAGSWRFCGESGCLGGVFVCGWVGMCFMGDLWRGRECFDEYSRGIG